MRTFGTIYKFELKKILQKRYILVLLALMLFITLFFNLKPLFESRNIAYLDETGELILETVSNLRAAQIERRFAKEWSGQILDNQMIVDMREMDAKYQEEYQKKCREMKYSEFDSDTDCILLNNYLIFLSVSNFGLNPHYAETDSRIDDIYTQISEGRKSEYMAQSLSQAEIDYWNAESENIAIPFKMAYSEGYSKILNNVSWLNMMILVFVLISLCSSFSDDDVYHTRTLLISAKYGRGRLMFIRLAAGESIALGSVLAVFGITAVIQFAVYGIDGFQTPMQMLSLSFGAWEFGKNLTAGQAVLQVVGVSLLLALLIGAISMLLSKLFKKAVPALALPFALLLLSLVFEIPFYNQNRQLAQIWSYFPFQRIDTFLIDERLASFHNIQLNCVQMSILLYGGLTLIALIVCASWHKLSLVDRK